MTTPDPPTPHPFAIRARNICFAFTGTPVLQHIDVDIAWGAITAIAGPNGAGKSTLIEILAGTRPPSAGTVHRSGDLAFVVQHPAAPDTLPLTVQQVVEMGTWTRRLARSHNLGRQERRARVRDALARVHLNDLAERSFNTLSSGQRQRALLAQGIARQADVFLLDEPAAGLDADSRARTQQILVAEADRGAAIACVTHDDAAIASADSVVRLEQGRRIDAF